MDNSAPLLSGLPPMTVRLPAVAGSFYPEKVETLREQLDALIPAARKEQALALIAPHAGYAYSGKVAGAAFGRVEIPRDVVILCFNHHGAGSDFAVWPSGAWRTPPRPCAWTAGPARGAKAASLPSGTCGAGPADH